MTIKNVYQVNRRDWLFFAAFFFAGCFLIIKAPFGFCYNDEPYILSSAHRMIFGDGILVDEWFPAQLVGFIIYPIMRIFHAINGNMDGAILVFRYCFVAMWTATALFAYWRLRARPFAGLAVLCFYLYAPLDYMTLSYNSIALASLIVFLCIMLTCKNMIAYVIGGIALAVAVLCCPPLILLFIIYSFAVLYKRREEKRREEKRREEKRREEKRRTGLSVS